MRVRVALTAGLALIAIAIALVLSGSPIRVAGTNSVPLVSNFASLDGGSRVCQAGETLPRGTSAIRLALEATIGPRVMLTALSGRRVVTHGARGSGWTGSEVTVPVGPIRHTTPHATLCFALGPSREATTIIGVQTRPSATASSTEPSAGRMRVEYLAAGDRSWWSSALSVARRIGLGRAPSGTWVVVILVALMAAVATLTSYLSIRDLETARAPEASGPRCDKAAGTPAGRFVGLVRAANRVPTAAWVCALVACLNAVCWSILTPPFQTPDEPAHFAYVQQLAEAHRLPVGSSEEFSPEQQIALEDLHQAAVRFSPGVGTVSAEAQERKLEHDLSQPLPRRGPGDAGTAASEPPLYYALEAIPYYIGLEGTLLDRLELMRLLAALFGGLTALFAFMFIREALPRTPWAWTVGGLAVALAPLLGFMSGAVNPDAMLFAVSAALFYLLARAFRRGLTPKLAAALGATIAIGVLTKLNFLGLLPGAILALVVLALKAPRESRRTAQIALAIAIAIAAIPVILYSAAKSLVNQASPTLVSGFASTAAHGSVLGEISYIWQLYLPRLPGMTAYFPSVFTTRQLWFNGLIGLYGWADTAFPGWVYDVALVPAGLIAVLCLRALVLSRGPLRRRTAELFVYALMGVGLLLVVGDASYASDILGHQGPYWEPRYFVPLIPLLGTALTLAARGAGRRWGPAVGVLIIVLVLAHDVFSQLLVVSRYYS